ncbi:hypothetical protein FVA74_00465 [Salinibacterium sp. dk2585]|uniref:hypothetical protein n=1 Tax=unclassified Salinibacterium TaxID=2632331 RepID=UPI0011C24485|nr:MULTISPECIES: hypothetical protein [unclassified Salinibacterium]QEE60200.1 hypothetical protein FVA74_00465 [Salinibacterium sp. dk2585]TXK55272.1 hypothetical protein FVP63_00610 [Salinibacterium sp. dk5596]
MSPRRFRLDGASLAELRQRVTEEHGPDARIIAAEQITTGGVGGFFASRRFQVTVEVPDGPTPAADAHDLSSRLTGIAALLEEADAAESALSAPPVGTVLRDDPFRSRAATAAASLPASAAAPAAAPEPELVSTSTRSFAEVLEDLQAVTEHEHPPLPGMVTSRSSGIIAPTPPLADGAGDLVAVIGLPADALAVARAMSFTVQAEVVVSGAALAEGLERLDTRRDAITVRARAVQRERIVVAAHGMSSHEPTPAQAQALADLKPDQVWVAVDAGRKHEDTARWVKAVGAVVTINAVAAIGRDGTSTPDTVRELGMPVSWAYDG